MNKHLRDSAVGITDVHKGQDTEEKVHGRMEPAVQSGKEDDEGVPQQSHQIHGQEEDEEGGLRLPAAGQPQQHELTHPCLVFPAHEPLRTKSKWYINKYQILKEAEGLIRSFRPNSHLALNCVVSQIRLLQSFGPQ